MTMNFTIVDKTKLGFCLLAGMEMLLILFFFILGDFLMLYFKMSSLNFSSLDKYDIKNEFHLLLLA